MICLGPIMEYLELGRLSYSELGIYVSITRQADRRTGVWMGSAAKLAALGPREANHRRIRVALQHLATLGLIGRPKRLPNYGNYPVSILNCSVNVRASKRTTVTVKSSDTSKAPVVGGGRPAAVQRPSNRRPTASYRE